MIAFLKGMVEDITENSLVLDVHGVGYEVLVPGQILDRMGPGVIWEMVMRSVNSDN